MRTKFLLIALLLMAAGSLKAQNTYNSYGAFNGTSSCIAIPFHAELRPTTQMTIEAWISPEQAGTGTRAIYGSNPNTTSFPFLGLAGTENKAVFILNGMLTGKSSIPLNQWTHIAAVYNGTHKSIYINGYLDTSVATTGTVPPNLDSTYIGASLLGNYFKGKMDDLRLWSIARTNVEIHRDMYIPLTCFKPLGIYAGLVGVWRFDINGAQAFDEGGNIGNQAFNRNVTITPYGNKTPVNYEYNSSLVLSGAGDYCAAPPNSRLNATTAITLEAWIKRNTNAPSPSTNQYLITKANSDGNIDYALIFRNTGELRFMGGNVQTGTQPLVTTSEWTHVAVVYNSAASSLTFYVNGDSIPGSGSSAPIQNDADSLFIGSLPNGSTFVGQIDEVRIWKNIARTSKEIKENMYRNINYKSSPAPSPSNFMVFSFDGRTDDTGNDALTNSASGLRFYGSAHMHGAKRNTDVLTSPIIGNDQADFMNASYNTNNKRFHLPDDGVTSAYDSVFYGTDGTVSNMKVYLLLSSASSSHVEVTLTAPNGTSVQLTPNASIGDAAGANGTNDIITIFSQDADTTITYAYNTRLAPFSPKIKPYQSLAAFNGMNRQGWWKIKFTDKYDFDQAYVHGWGIQTSSLTSNEPVTETPQTFELKQNYPNPFNPVTKISYSIPKAGMVKMNVFDITGKVVATLVNEVKSAGSYEMEFNGVQLASGVYFYRLETEGFTDIKKMMLIK